MSLKIPPKKNAQKEKMLDDFSAGAVDRPARKTGGFMKCHKRQISLTIAPDLLDQFDALAAKQGQTRSALISRLLFEAIQHDKATDPQQ